jgi:hypothetical protein
VPVSGCYRLIERVKFQSVKGEQEEEEEEEEEGG